MVVFPLYQQALTCILSRDGTAGQNGLSKPEGRLSQSAQQSGCPQAEFDDDIPRGRGHVLCSHTAIGRTWVPHVRLPRAYKAPRRLLSSPVTTGRTVSHFKEDFTAK